MTDKTRDVIRGIVSDVAGECGIMAESAGEQEFSVVVYSDDNARLCAELNRYFDKLGAFTAFENHLGIVIVRKYQEVNKFGVPLHEYVLMLAGSDPMTESGDGWVAFDIADEGRWGCVSGTAFDLRTKNGRRTTTRRPFIGYGDDERGYYRIKRVREPGVRDVPVRKFLEIVEQYAPFYSC